MKKRNNVSAYRPPTMSDVAKSAKVSRQLVGLVFRGQPGVSLETERKIRKIAKEIGYRPNIAAQSLRKNSAKKFGVIFHSEEAVMADLLPSLHSQAAELGYDLILSAVNEEHNENSAVESLLGHRCNGIILISSRLSLGRLKNLAREIPLVSIGRRVKGVRCGIVSSHGEVGVESAVNYLISLGHKKICYVEGPDMLDAEYRLAGYKRAMKKNQLVSKIISIPGDFATIGGAAAADQILNMQSLPTAIICNNDESAMGLWHRLMQNGIKIPEQISIVGYDDSLAKFPFLDMTTVRQDSRELAQAAVLDLTKRVSGEIHNSRTYLTSARLVVRTSTCKPMKAHRSGSKLVK